jgi:predicted phosphodiesterase
MPKVLQIYAGPAARNAPRKPPGNVLRLVCMSDTHTTVERRCVQAPETLGEWVPQGDVFLHAGDFSNTGKLSEVKLFESFLRMLPHPYKIVIAGNHEISFDPSCRLRMYGNAEQMAAQVKAMVCHPSEGIHYLEDSAVTLAGLCFYGSPRALRLPQPTH